MHVRVAPPQPVAQERRGPGVLMLAIGDGAVRKGPADHAGPPEPRRARDRDTANDLAVCGEGRAGLGLTVQPYDRRTTQLVALDPARACGERDGGPVAQDEAGQQLDLAPVRAPTRRQMEAVT